MYITKDITQRQGAYIKPKEKMEKKEILTSDFFKERERERERHFLFDKSSITLLFLIILI